MCHVEERERTMEVLSDFLVRVESSPSAAGPEPADR
jgi:hypothetical protein